MRAVTRVYDDALRPVDLRITQYSILSALASQGEARVRDLASRLLLEETTLTRSLRPLELQGWIGIRPGIDRRERLLSVTPAGRDLLKKARPLWKSAQDRMRDSLSPTTWDGLFHTLPRVAEAAEQI